MSQFRKLNRPTLIDNLWNLKSHLFSNFKYKKVFFEFSSYLYRFKHNIVLGQNVYLKRNSIIGCANREAKLKIGENTTIGNNTIIVSSKDITIGKNCMIAPFVHILDSNHGLSLKENFSEQENSCRSVEIKDNCWIGSGVTILSGVVLEENVVVGAGSVVTKSFPKNSVLVGIPAKIKKILK
jgi:acetyltransferase-like isoleucine patch superfamily enzyme